MISRGTGSNPRGRATERGLHVALILGIIFVMGVIPTGGLEASAGATAGSPLFSLIMEPEAMDTQRSAMEQWLLELGFFYDKTLGRVRNPFDFPRGEADPALKECFVALGGESDYSNRRLIVGPAGSGKTAQLIMMAQGRTHLQYQSAVVFMTMLDDIIAITTNKPNEAFTITLDIEDNDTADPLLIAQLLDKIHTLQLPQQSPHICIALPEKFLPLAKPYQPWIIQWDSQLLANFLKARLLWASNGTHNDLARICAENVKEPHEKLSAQARTPRHLFELGQYLFHAHPITALPKSGIRLQENDWNLLLAYTQFKQPKRSEQPVLSREVESTASQSLPRTQQLEELYELLRKLDDTQLETFLLIHCPVVYDKKARGMRRDEKINLLLEHCHYNPEVTQEIIAIVKYYIKKINTGG